MFYCLLRRHRGCHAEACQPVGSLHCRPWRMPTQPPYSSLPPPQPCLAGMQLIFATDLQTRLAVKRLYEVVTATWG